MKTDKYSRHNYLEGWWIAQGYFTFSGSGVWQQWRGMQSRCQRTPPSCQAGATCCQRKMAGSVARQGFYDAGIFQEIKCHSFQNQTIIPHCSQFLECALTSTEFSVVHEAWVWRKLHHTFKCYKLAQVRSEWWSWGRKCHFMSRDGAWH